MLSTLPNAVICAIRKLNHEGYEAYAVGGCVRDCLMAREPQDWDIATSATPAQMQSVFSEYRTIETGIKHGTLTVLIDELPLEITTYRVDGDYSDGRHPDTVSFTTSLTEDLRRRDFTINAMAYHPNEGILDPFGGRDDVRRGIIRCVGDPDLRFSEDALRILRALRFSSTLGFPIETNTANALTALSANLSQVSKERLLSEFVKLLCGKNADRIITQYHRVLSTFLPEIQKGGDFALLSRVNASVHTRWAALFYAANVSAQHAETALRRLRCDNKTIRQVTLLLDTPKTAFAEDSQLLRLLYRLDSELIFDYFSLIDADHCIVKRAKHLLKENVCYKASMLAVDGSHIIGAGISPSPAVGKMLEELLFAVMDSKCPNETEELLNYVKKQKKPVQ